VPFASISRFLIFALVSASLVGCGADGGGGDVGTGTGGGDDDGALEAAIEARTDELLAEMTLEEKLAQKAGSGLREGVWLTPRNGRLGMYGMAMVDGPRGVSKETGSNTAFPVAMARGATWDPELERRVAAAIGREARARGANVLLGPCINLLRHPRWGRAQETYGEDTHHLSRFGVAFVEGAQTELMASAKHFAANSIEDTRFDVSVQMDERTLREIYLPAFRAVVEEADVASMMTAYNRVDGKYMAEQAELLGILKDEWAFSGFVESDWIWGTKSTVPSALAGLDIEMPDDNFFGNPLMEAVSSGEVTEAVIDASARRVIRAQVKWGLVDDGPVARFEAAPMSEIEKDEHIALAHEAAVASMVLLRNEGQLLPLHRPSTETIAVVGALADTPNIGDNGSSDVEPSRVVTPLMGLRQAAPSAVVDHLGADDVLDMAEATDVAAADVAIVVVGLTADDEGEYIPVINNIGDRESLSLSDTHQQLIADVVGANPNTIVVLEGGSTILVDPWRASVPGIVMAWYPGGEGGHALAELLFGGANFSGRLPATVPRDEADLVEFDNESLDVTYGYFHGYRALDRNGVAPRYAFGFGLSYTQFTYDALRQVGEGDDITLTFEVDVTNAGDAAGAEVVQLYLGHPGSSVERSVRTLAAFRRVDLEPGETATVTLSVPVADLAHWNASTSAWVIEDGEVRVEVGRNAGDLPLSTAVDVPDPR